MFIEFGAYHFYIYIWPARYTKDLYYTMQILGYTYKKTITKPTYGCYKEYGWNGFIHNARK
jgi:hypothetical protein